MCTWSNSDHVSAESQGAQSENNYIHSHWYFLIGLAVKVVAGRLDRCSRAARWTVMRHIRGGSEKEGWYFSKDFVHKQAVPPQKPISHQILVSIIWFYLLSVHPFSCLPSFPCFLPIPCYTSLSIAYILFFLSASILPHAPSHYSPPPLQWGALVRVI